ncbi:MAG TPA: hypothetical protein EYG68_01365 [Leucothrix mucor]|nr:hypothetical protein [Leucothrix mucor]
MKHKIIITSCIFFGCYTLGASEIPNQVSGQNTKPSLNFSLPPHSTSSHQNIAANTKNSPTLTLTKRSSKLNFLVLNSTKNSELKAVIKRKTYGLRYTKVW